MYEFRAASSPSWLTGELASAAFAISGLAIAYRNRGKQRKTKNRRRRNSDQVRIGLAIVHALLLSEMVFRQRGYFYVSQLLVTTFVVLPILSFRDSRETGFQAYLTSYWFWQAVIQWANLGIASFSFSAGCSSGVLFISEALTCPLLKQVLTYFDRMRFTWLTPIILNIRKHHRIRLEDVATYAVDLSTEKVTALLERNLSVQNSAGLASALLRSFWPLFIIASLAQLTGVFLQFLRPLFLRNLILFAEERYKGTSLPMTQGIWTSLAMFLASLISPQIAAVEVTKLEELSVATTVSLKTLVFKKSLRITRQERDKYPSGKFVTLLNADIDKIGQSAQNMSSWFTAPFQILICMYSLRKLVGSAMYFGMTIWLLTIPINTYLIGFIAKHIKVSHNSKEKRNQAVQDLFSSIRIVKLYAWEKLYVKRIFAIRDKEELSSQRATLMWNRIANLFLQLSPFLVSLSTISWFTHVKRQSLTADILFPTLSTLQLMQKPIHKFPALFTSYSDAKLSMEKISHFLSASETPLKLSDDNSNNAIHLNGTFYWHKSKKSQIALHLEDLKIEKGHSVFIVGKVGTGKTAFLLAILGELERDKEDSVVVNGSVAYVPQTPWLMDTSFRENILFGHEYDEDTFKAVLQACQLTEDVAKLPKHDLTHVGSKGLKLSGGQKARLALARAIYANADIYVVDDVLSAVDNHVGQKLIDEVFSPAGILAGKTVILATNNIPVLAHSREVIYLDEASVAERARFEDIRNSRAFPKLKTHLSDHRFEHTRQKFPFAKNMQTVSYKDEAPEILKKHLKQYLTEGKQKQVHFHKSVYWRYLKACSIPTVLFAFVLSILCSVFTVYTDLWLKNWVDSETIALKRPFYHILGYTAIGLSKLLIASVRSWVLLGILGLSASKTIFEMMTMGLSQTKPAFFDKLPMGKLTSRYGRDIHVIETTLPKKMFKAVQNLSSVIITFAVITYSFPAIVILWMKVGACFWYYQKAYLVARKEAKHFAGTYRGSFTSLAQEASRGVETIRAFGQTKRFVNHCYALCDSQIRVQFLSSQMPLWLSVRCQFLSSSIGFVISMYFVLTSGKWGAPGGTVGFVMGYAFTITKSLKSMVNLTSDLDTEFFAVQRCLEYANLQPEEKQDEGKAVGNDWNPSEIKFDHYSGSHGAGTVLRDISFIAQKGQKIGVIGRTGAGKSSIILALFRMLESEGGMIYVDQVNTEELKLYDLRNSISIIPQEAHLFSGTIRENLDPGGSFADQQIWDSLEDATLKDYVCSLGGLDSEVNEGGSNFSAGQKQLFCLSRALLKDKHILIMDEATASIDNQTDQIIQNLLRKKAANKTIVTIAHRTKTILDSDKILALEDGKVTRFDTPESMLSDADSLLSKFLKAGV